MSARRETRAERHLRLMREADASARERDARRSSTVVEGGSLWRDPAANPDDAAYPSQYEEYEPVEPAPLDKLLRSV